MSTAIISREDLQIRRVVTAGSSLLLTTQSRLLRAIRRLRCLHQWRRGNPQTLSQWLPEPLQAPTMSPSPRCHFLMQRPHQMWTQEVPLPSQFLLRTTLLRQCPSMPVISAHSKSRRRMVLETVLSKENRPLEVTTRRRAAFRAPRRRRRPPACRRSCALPSSTTNRITT